MSQHLPWHLRFVFADEAINAFIEVARTVGTWPTQPARAEVAKLLGVPVDGRDGGDVTVDICDEHGDIYDDIAVTRDDVAKITGCGWSTLYAGGLDRLNDGDKPAAGISLVDESRPLSLPRPLQPGFLGIEMDE